MWVSFEFISLTVENFEGKLKKKKNEMKRKRRKVKVWSICIQIIPDLMFRTLPTFPTLIIILAGWVG